MTCSNREKHLYGISNGPIHEWTEVSEVLAQPSTSNSQTDWNVNFVIQLWDIGRSQWPRGLRCRSAAVRLLRLWVRIPAGAWVSVCCECCVLSEKCLCDELITRPEESYRLWYVVVCDLKTSWMRRPRPTWGCRAKNKQTMMGHRIWLINSIRLLAYSLYRFHELITGAWRRYWTSDDPWKQYVYMKVLCWTMCIQTDCPYIYIHIYIYIYIYIHIYIYTHTQGVPGGMCQTSGGYSLC